MFNGGALGNYSLAGFEMVGNSYYYVQYLKYAFTLGNSHQIYMYNIYHSTYHNRLGASTLKLKFNILFPRRFFKSWFSLSSETRYWMKEFTLNVEMLELQWLLAVFLWNRRNLFYFLLSTPEILLFWLNFHLHETINGEGRWWMINLTLLAKLVVDC